MAMPHIILAVLGRPCGGKCAALALRRHGRGALAILACRAAAAPAAAHRQGMSSTSSAKPRNSMKHTVASAAL